MRTAGTIHPTSTMTVTAATATSKATFSPPATIQRSQWHSPVPYLFGGLAAMLGLIAFALLILACSYWKLSGHSDNRENGDRDIEAGEENSENTAKALPDFEEKIVVIMAGDVKPTFLARPISSRASSFGDGNCCKSENKVMEKSETAENPKEEIGGHEPTPPAAAAAPPTTTTENRKTGETHASQEQNQ